MLEIQEGENGTVIHLTQERLDITVATKLLSELDVILTGGKKGVILNLKPVTYMDSSVLGVLVNFQKKIKAAGKTLVVTGLSPSIKKVFELTKLNLFFNIKE